MNISKVLIGLGIFVCMGMSCAYAQTNSGGSGTAGDPWKLATVADLNSFASYVDGAGSGASGKYFILTNNIDFQNASFAQVGKLNAFEGNFNGNGLTISNIKISNAAGGAGFFNKVGSNGVVKNVTISGGTISGIAPIGALIAVSNSSNNIENCHVNNVTITSTFNSHAASQYNIGGLIGEYITYLAASIKISNCSTSGLTLNVPSLTDGSLVVGGLVGKYTGDVEITDVTIQNESMSGYGNLGGLIGHATGTVVISNVAVTLGSITTANNADRVGGLIGWSRGTVNVSSASVTVSQVTAGNQFGGIIGRSNDVGSITIRNSYYKGERIEAANQVGGLIGIIESTGVSVIESSYSEVKDIIVTGTNVGGLIGYVSEGSSFQMSNCYHDGDNIIGTDKQNIGGLVGQIYGDGCSITSSFNRSDISGGEYLGGLVGVASTANTTLTVTSSYNTGDISGRSDCGGIVGKSRGNVVISNVYTTGALDIQLGGVILGSASSANLTNCYHPKCIMNEMMPFDGENGTSISVSEMTSDAFAETLGAPFYKDSPYSLPKLPKTNHFFVSIYSPEDTGDEFSVIDCVHDVSAGGSFSQTFIYPINELMDNGAQITSGNQTYTISDITTDHYIAPFIATTLDITVFLYGPMQGATMSNYIQTAHTTASAFSAAKLPVENPYDVYSYDETDGWQKVQYEQINNANGPAGAVVDWVRVDICDSDDISSIAESRALLLKPDGSIVDIDGKAPAFLPYSSTMRICIRHRNHLTVVSNPIDNFEGKITYDFSTFKTQAYAPGGENIALQSADGKWCMWPGYIVRDGVIGDDDKALIDAQTDLGSFNLYQLEDVNMDGVVDNVDQSMLHYARREEASSPVR